MIDFDFIQQLEGNRCDGYVPDPENSNSGVTIGCGFDLGARDENELRQAFSDELAAKLIPYSKLKKQQAVEVLEQFPLKVNDQEVLEINRFAKQQAVQKLISQWDQDEATDILFEELSDLCQTVIASVAFQYGDLKRRTPRFWQQIVSGNWQDALQNLRDFGDRYHTRRNKEADLLSGWINDNLT